MEGKQQRQVNIIQTQDNWSKGWNQHEPQLIGMWKREDWCCWARRGIPNFIQRISWVRHRGQHRDIQDNRKRREKTGKGSTLTGTMKLTSEWLLVLVRWQVLVRETVEATLTDGQNEQTQDEMNLRKKNKRRERVCNDWCDFLTRSGSQFRINVLSRAQKLIVCIKRRRARWPRTCKMAYETERWRW